MCPSTSVARMKRYGARGVERRRKYYMGEGGDFP